MKMIRWITLMVLAISCFNLVAGVALAEKSGKAVNRIVVIVDCSGSFRNQYPNALKQIQNLLEELSKAKRKRWEGKSDQVVLISLDALPHVVWKGSIQALKSANVQEIVSLFSSRKEFSSCTDVDAAFDLAFRNLDGDPKFISKYLFIFSDLIHESPTKSVRVCNRPVFVPGMDFPWDLLEDVSTTVFWMPADQQLIWKKNVEARGLGEQFVMYSSGFSERTVIPAPPKAKVRISGQEAVAFKETWISSAGTIGKVIGTFVLIVVVVFISLVVILRFRRNSRQSRSMTGNIPRMPAARLVNHPGPRHS